MTALDTHVIVRYLVKDNAEQAEAARQLLDGLTPTQPGFICREVIIEVAWVLERSYRFPRTRISDALMELTAVDNLVIEDANEVAVAAHRYRQGGVGFSDLMILQKTQRMGYSPLYTFDQKLGRLQGATLLIPTSGTST